METKVNNKVSANTTKGKVVKKVADNVTSYKVEVIGNNKAYKSDLFKLGKQIRIYLQVEGATQRSKELLQICQTSTPIFKLLEQYGQSTYKGVATGKSSMYKVLQLVNKFSSILYAMNKGETTQQAAAQNIAKAIDDARAKRIAKATK